MARVFVGLPSLQGAIHNYGKRFDLVEVRPVDTPTPRPSTLRSYRKSVGPSFAFSVVLPKAVAELGSGAAFEEALSSSLEVARLLEARCIVLATPASVRPTSANRKRIKSLFERVPREGVVLAWEPQGIWERDDILETAADAGVLPVFDATTEAPGPGSVVYTRLRALGKTAALGASTIEKLAERLRSRREAYVVVEGPAQAKRVRQGLAAALERMKAGSRGSMVFRPAVVSGAIVAEDEEQ